MRDSSCGCCLDRHQLQHGNEQRRSRPVDDPVRGSTASPLAAVPTGRHVPVRLELVCSDEDLAGRRGEGESALFPRQRVHANRPGQLERGRPRPTRLPAVQDSLLRLRLPTDGSGPTTQGHTSRSENASRRPRRALSAKEGKARTELPNVSHGSNPAAPVATSRGSPGRSFYSL